MADRSSIRRVLTYGTYDALHYGHVNLLQRARALGDSLTVGLSTDAFNAMKNKHALLSYEERFRLLSAIRYVDDIIPEDNWEQKIGDVRENDIDVFVMGDDWAGKFDFLKPYCEVVYLTRTPVISTTLIKNGIAR